MRKNILVTTGVFTVIACGMLLLFGGENQPANTQYVSAQINVSQDISVRHPLPAGSNAPETRFVPDTNIDQMMSSILNDLRNISANPDTASTMAADTPEMAPDIQKPASAADLNLARNSAMPTPAIHKIHKVKPGESLATIAILYYGHKDGFTAIYKANKPQISSPHKIRVGQMLIIPKL